MSAAASVVAAVVLGGGVVGGMARGSRIPVRCAGVERVVVERGGERGVGGGVMMGSRIPVRMGGSSVRYETSKSLQAGLGSRIPVMKGTSMRYVITIPSLCPLLTSSLSSPVNSIFFIGRMLTITVAPNTGRALLNVS